jgi:hypothetical protein
MTPNFLRCSLGRLTHYREVHALSEGFPPMDMDWRSNFELL